MSVAPEVRDSLIYTSSYSGRTIWLEETSRVQPFFSIGFLSEVSSCKHLQGQQCPLCTAPLRKKKKKSSLCAVGMLHHAALSYWCCPCAPPRRAGFFMMESFLMHAEGSQKNSPLFSHLQEHQNDTSLTLIHLLCYSSLLSQWPPLTPRDQCCPMEAS